jgi:CheY-like chemotaxis protein
MSPGQVLRRIKSDANATKIPVLMLTTTDDPRDIDRCDERGCNVYTTKLVDPSVFIEAIQRLDLLIAGVSVPIDPVNPP